MLSRLLLSLAGPALALLFVLGLGGCALLPGRGPVRRIVDAASDAELTVPQLVGELATADVVFLGEVHDSAPAHALQLEVTRALAEERGGVVLSLEMFERDVQADLDAYLAGALDEEAFLDVARPWKDYADAYRPAVEEARARGWPVVAACLPRDLAMRIAAEGLEAVAGDEYLPRSVTAEPGPYRDRFEEAMGEHDGFEEGQLDRWFASQCAKDDAMAEAIADAVARRGEGGPPVVHWCGRFHSDFGLGTVSRLRARRPDLEIAVVTTVRRRSTLDPLEGEDRERAAHAFLVRR